MRPPTLATWPAGQVFNSSVLYTPGNLRADNKANSSANLRDIVFPGAALNGSWPTIGALRGKVLFFADPDYTSELLSVCAPREAPPALPSPGQPPARCEPASHFVIAGNLCFPYTGAALVAEDCSKLYIKDCGNGLQVPRCCQLPALAVRRQRRHQPQRGAALPPRMAVAGP